MPKPTRRPSQKLGRPASRRPESAPSSKPAPTKKPTRPTKQSAKQKLASKQAGKGTSRAGSVGRGGRGGVPRGTPPPSSPHTLPRRKDQHLEIIARAVVLLPGRVLLCRNLKHGYLYLPGGHVEFGEPAAEACRRELAEECGLKIAPGPLLLVTEETFSTKKRQHHEINLIFRAEAVPDADTPYPTPKSLERVRSLEPAIALEWTDLAAIVDLDIRPLSAKALLAGGAISPVSPAGLGAEWHSGIPT
ncbi:MAG: NUDIX domain-containing protein [Phycisphaeraceae bacterium]|nr:NUDIX domain-containing protein [Phycisphaeraceae bacterium]